MLVEDIVCSEVHREMIVHADFECQVEKVVSADMLDDEITVGVVVANAARVSPALLIRLRR
jgi:hypothetical protein